MPDPPRAKLGSVCAAWSATNMPNRSRSLAAVVAVIDAA